MNEELEEVYGTGAERTGWERCRQRVGLSEGQHDLCEWGMIFAMGITCGAVLVAAILYPTCMHKSENQFIHKQARVIDATCVERANCYSGNDMLQFIFIGAWMSFVGCGSLFIGFLKISTDRPRPLRACPTES